VIDLLWTQREVGLWSRNNFPNNTPMHPLLGIMEEVGELCHAHLKGEQGIRMSKEEIFDAKEDAVGDILIYLLDYCHRSGINMADTLEVTWSEVSKRDWVKYPANGLTE